MRRIGLLASAALLLGAFALSWFTHGTGVVRNDPERHISIPSTLTVPMQVQVAYDGTDVLFRYRWRAPNAGIFHDVLRFQGGAWQVRGRAVPGSEPDGLHEDRVAMMLDDGSVPEFGRYGGYITVGSGLVGLTGEASEAEVKANPELGGAMRQEEVSKYLPATRRDPAKWGTVVPEAERRQLQTAGYFLDLWHWRANRSNPIGFADDQYVAAARLSDAGRAPYATNWDGANRRPRLMLDPAKAGRNALRWDDVAQGRIGQDSGLLPARGRGPAVRSEPWLAERRHHPAPDPASAAGLARGYPGRWQWPLGRWLVGRHAAPAHGYRPPGGRQDHP